MIEGKWVSARELARKLNLSTETLRLAAPKLGELVRKEHTGIGAAGWGYMFHPLLANSGAYRRIMGSGGSRNMATKRPALIAKELERWAAMEEKVKA